MAVLTPGVRVAGDKEFGVEQQFKQGDNGAQVSSSNNYVSPQRANAMQQLQPDRIAGNGMDKGTVWELSEMLWSSRARMVVLS